MVPTQQHVKSYGPSDVFCCALRATPARRSTMLVVTTSAQMQASGQPHPPSTVASTREPAAARLGPARGPPREVSACTYVWEPAKARSRSFLDDTAV